MATEMYVIETLVDGNPYWFKGFHEDGKEEWSNVVRQAWVFASAGEANKVKDNLTLPFPNLHYHAQRVCGGWARRKLTRQLVEGVADGIVGKKKDTPEDAYDRAMRGI